MRTFELTITERYQGRTAGQLLRNHFGLSSRLVTKLKQTDGIRRNGLHINTNEQLNLGDVFTVLLPEERSCGILPQNIPLSVVYEDDDLLVVNKPCNMPVHPSFSHFENTLGNAVCYYFRDQPFVYRPVNRLDKDTTGLVVIAKTAPAGHRLSLQMQDGRFQKHYLAVLEGTPEPLEGVIDAPIRRDPGSILKRCVAPDGQRAVTAYQVIAVENGLSLVRVHLLTGRTHQIRVHFSHLGCPLYSDFLYGTQVEDTRFYLHCHQLSFFHPVTGLQVQLTCPPPKDLTKMVPVPEQLL